MKLTLNKLKQLKQDQQKIVCLTAYDAAFAYWAATAKVEVLLVGDSLGMVVQGEATTLPVTVEQMVYHTQAVQRGNQQAANQAWVIADLPFMADLSLQTALEAASALIKQAGADMVKLEGACAKSLAITEALSRHGVPVCGHLGLLPQSVLKKGYQVVGREQAAAKQLITEAQALESAGADMLVLECVPISLAQQISETLKIPVIGIGSGADTDGQVLVSYDLVGLTPGRVPSFSKNFLAETNSIYQAFVLYVAAVKQKKFPAVEHFMA